MSISTEEAVEQDIRLAALLAAAKSNGLGFCTVIKFADANGNSVSPSFIPRTPMPPNIKRCCAMGAANIANNDARFSAAGKPNGKYSPTFVKIYSVCATVAGNDQCSFTYACSDGSSSAAHDYALGTAFRVAMETWDEE